MWSLQQCADNAVFFLRSLPSSQRWHDLSGGDLRGPAFLPREDVVDQLGIAPEALAARLERAGYVVAPVVARDGVSCVGVLWAHNGRGLNEGELALTEQVERITGTLVTPEYIHVQNDPGR